MSQYLLIYMCAALAIAASTYLVALVVLRMGAERTTERDLDESCFEEDILIKWLLPLAKKFSSLVEQLKMPAWRKATALKLRKAGLAEVIEADEFGALKGVGLGLACVLYPLVKLLIGGEVSALGLMISCLIGFVAPNFWLKDKITARSKSILRDFPYTLDLLTISIESNMDFVRAIERLVENLKRSQLTTEYSILLRELKMGKSRRDVLRRLARRIELPDVDSFVSALVQADELGVPIGPILRTISEQTRENRAQRAEKLAGEAPVKLLFPLMIVFVAVCLVVFTPVGMQIYRAFH